MSSTPQGFGHDSRERLPMLDRDAMTEAQRAAADALIAGPRKAVLGPFVPLLRCPGLLERVGKLGEALRFEGVLPDRIRELAICAIARETSNQFEWQTHVPLAVKAGATTTVIEQLADGARPRELDDDASAALDLLAELVRHHGVCDATWRRALGHFGEPGAVELTVLAGYFVTVCWVMNVARTPGVAGSTVPGLEGLPV